MSFVDAYGSEVCLTDNYIRYRDRILDYTSISVFQVKQKKLLINNFHQNTTLPTMCIHFKTKEEALEVLDTLADMYSAEEKSVSLGWSGWLSKVFGW